MEKVVPNKIKKFIYDLNAEKFKIEELRLENNKDCPPEEWRKIVADMPENIEYFYTYVFISKDKIIPMAFIDPRQSTFLPSGEEIMPCIIENNEVHFFFTEYAKEVDIINFIKSNVNDFDIARVTMTYEDIIRISNDSRSIFVNE